MCAAPGSKTAQIIEMVHANEQPKVVPSKAFDDFFIRSKGENHHRDLSGNRRLTALLSISSAWHSGLFKLFQLDLFSPTTPTTDAVTC